MRYPFEVNHAQNPCIDRYDRRCRLDRLRSWGLLHLRAAVYIDACARRSTRSGIPYRSRFTAGSSSGPVDDARDRTDDKWLANAA